MNILKIEAGREFIALYTDGEGAVTVTETTAVAGPNPPRVLSETDTKAENGRILLSRLGEGYDRIYSRFSVTADGIIANGVQYVTDFTADLPENDTPYPQPSTIKTLAAPPHLSKELNIQQGLLNINLLAIMTTAPSDDTIPYEHNGKTYYFVKSAVEGIDRQMLSVPMTTMILLNAPKSFASRKEQALMDQAMHPDFDWSYPSAFISAFNMETEEGMGYYGAFLEFLAERYTRPDKKYGCAVGAIISNEVNSQYVWGNAGEKTVEAYMAEYTNALRLAWICGRKHCSHFRVYISLDHFWSGVNFSAGEPLRYYSGRTMIDLLNTASRKEGNFDWAIAYHPYPENLNFPDFWNDRAPTFAFDTPKITFKNIEVLGAYLEQEDYLYRGKPRRVIFSEQGFNSQNGPTAAITEKQGEAAYVLAYLKSRNMPIVDMMTHHSCVDNPGEFGLNLGIYRHDPTKPGRVGEAKPILNAFLAMDTPAEEAAVAKARAFIGEELFDLLLHPPVLRGAIGHVDPLGNA